MGWRRGEGVPTSEEVGLPQRGALGDMPHLLDLQEDQQALLGLQAEEHQTVELQELLEGQILRPTVDTLEGIESANHPIGTPEEDKQAHLCHEHERDFGGE